eukprot:CAMPEP_0178775540 /NCGR_PEP_ID=MMETSP0744-20121128/24249_1 /TAXON_ID=913974 /ORGANISM="Nitzschia punctata, Strain CCMP561" /LENGTH=361 /DNA_ID=CAMNT_0020432529 /DNA_START=34 /DNA_END=1119 /DNA_ORIENTATION=-
MCCSSTTSPPSKWQLGQQLQGHLRTLDERLSRPLFDLSLPASLEAIFSVPACFFGLVPAVAVGPIWLAILGLHYHHDPQIAVASGNKMDPHGDNNNNSVEKAYWLLIAIAVVFSIVFLVAWAMFLRGVRTALTKFLGKKVLYLLAFPWNVAVLYFTLLQQTDFENSSHPQQNDSQAWTARLAMERTFSLALYSCYLWSPSILFVLIMKRWSQRYRPCAKTSPQWIRANKAFPDIALILAKAQANESFPSGDAATAAVFAIPLAHLSPPDSHHGGWNVAVVTAWWMVLLACCGRVYVLAHHVSDVAVGATIPYLVHLISTSLLGVGVYDMQWWYPLASNVVVAAYAKLTSKDVQRLETAKKE